MGQLAGQAAGIPGLFAGVARAHLLGLIWFDKAQSGGAAIEAAFSDSACALAGLAERQVNLDWSACTCLPRSFGQRSHPE